MIYQASIGSYFSFEFWLDLQDYYFEIENRLKNKMYTLYSVNLHVCFQPKERMNETKQKKCSNVTSKHVCIIEFCIFEKSSGSKLPYSWITEIILQSTSATIYQNRNYIYFFFFFRNSKRIESCCKDCSLFFTFVLFCSFFTSHPSALLFFCVAFNRKFSPIKYSHQKPTVGDHWYEFLFLKQFMAWYGCTHTVKFLFLFHLTPFFPFLLLFFSILFRCIFILFISQKFRKLCATDFIVSRACCSVKWYTIKWKFHVLKNAGMGVCILLWVRLCNVSFVKTVRNFCRKLKIWILSTSENLYAF